MSMTPQQRYMLDTFGFLKLEAALSASELAAAQEAADRYITLAQQEPEALPPGFEQDSNDNRRFVYGFAFDKGLEALATHPAIMPIVMELTGGRPQLTMGTLQADGQPSQNFHNEGLSLHRAGDDSIPGTGPKLGVGPDGRMYCDDIVIFPYLDDVNPGDGARATPLSRLSLSRCVRACMNVCACVCLPVSHCDRPTCLTTLSFSIIGGLVCLPGSHKATYGRPGDLFGQFSLDLHLGAEKRLFLCAHF